MPAVDLEKLDGVILGDLKYKHDAKFKIALER